MKVKQTLRKILVGSVLMLTLPFAIATTMAQQGSGFSDVPFTNANYTAIMYLKAHGIINGYADGTFKPDQTVNRVEALKIILLGAAVTVQDDSGTGGFSDTVASEWYAKYLLKAKALSIVAGYPDGTFKPNQTVSLAENLKMLANTMKVDLSTIDVVNSDPFTDVSKDQWYAKYALYARLHKWVIADAQNMIYPAQGMTRGKLAQLMYNAIMNLPTNNTTPTQQQTQQQIWDTTDAMLVNITNSGFVKNSMTIAQGAKVLWTNKDTVPEDVTSDAGVFSSGTLQPGQSFEYTFNTLGTFNYHSSFNPSITGTIIIKLPIEVPTI